MRVAVAAECDTDRRGLAPPAEWPPPPLMDLSGIASSSLLAYSLDRTEEAAASRRRGGCRTSAAITFPPVQGIFPLSFAISVTPPFLRTRHNLESTAAQLEPVHAQGIDVSGHLCAS